MIARARSFFASGLLLAACVSGTPRSASTQGIRFVGRFDTSDPAGPRYAWSGSTMRVRFRGRSIAVRLRAAPVPPREGSPVEHATPYTAVIDGASHEFTVGEGENSYPVATGLDPSRDHEVSIFREAEALGGVHQLLGFDVDGELLPPPPPRKHSIEIVGDSITCGYGVLGADKTCPFSYATERASLAFGSLAANAVDADVTTVCWQGLGVIRNYDGTKAPTMPELFERTLPAEEKRWFDVARPAPDVVVVALGTNDFDDSTQTPLDLPAFEARFVTFLTRLRTVYPVAFIIVAGSPLLGPDPMPSGPGPVHDLATGAFTRAIAARHDARLSFLDLPWVGDKFGCDYHPNAEMQRILGTDLANALRAKLSE